MEVQWYIISIEIIYISVIPIASILLSILNVISAKIFMRKVFEKNAIYIYISANLICDSVMLDTIAFFSFFLCKRSCPWSGYLGEWPNAIEILSRAYIVRVSRLLNALFNITIVTYRYSCLTGEADKMNSRKKSSKIIFGYVIFAILYNIPNLLLKLGFFGKKKGLEIIVFLMQYMIQIIPSFIVLSMNLILINQIKDRLKPIKHARRNKNSLVSYLDYNNENQSFSMTLVPQSNNQKVNKKKVLIERRTGLQLNLMIISLSTVFILDNLVILLAYTFYIFGDTRTEFHKIAFIFIHFGIITTCSLNALTYYKFNKLFAKYFRKLFKR